MISNRVRRKGLKVLSSTDYNSNEKPPKTSMLELSLSAGNSHFAEEYDIKDVAKNSGVSSTTDITLSDNSDIFDPASLEKNSVKATAEVKFSGDIYVGDTIGITDYLGNYKVYTAETATSASDGEFKASVKEDIADGLQDCIEHANGHNGTIVVTNDSSGNLTLEQNVATSNGNTIIIHTFLPTYTEVDLSFSGGGPNSIYIYDIIGSSGNVLNKGKYEVIGIVDNVITVDEDLGSDDQYTSGGYIGVEGLVDPILEHKAGKSGYPVGGNTVSSNWAIIRLLNEKTDRIIKWLEGKSINDDGNLKDSIVDASKLKQANGSPSNGQILKYNDAVTGDMEWATGGGGGMDELVDDTSPVLGGDLDTNSKNIVFPTGNLCDDMIDDDTFSTGVDSTSIASSESIKAYVDTKAQEAEDAHDTVGELTDTNLTSLQDNQALGWNATTSKWQNMYVDTVNIADDAIEGDKVANDAIDTAQIADNAVDTDQIATGAINKFKIENNAVGGDAMADNAIGMAELKSDEFTRGDIIIGDASGDPAILALGPDTHVLTSDGSDIAWAAASGGGGGGTSYWLPQWSCKWSNKYLRWYFPSNVEGPNSSRWSSTWNTTTPFEDWPDDWAPFIVVPVNCTIQSYSLHGNATSSETYELYLGKGTPSWDDSAGNTTLSQVGTTHDGDWTSGRYNKIEDTGLSVSCTSGDILVPQLRRSTSDTGSTYYIEGIFSIIAEIS